MNCHHFPIPADSYEFLRLLPYKHILNDLYPSMNETLGLNYPNTSSRVAFLIALGMGDCEGKRRRSEWRREGKYALCSSTSSSHPHLHHQEDRGGEGVVARCPPSLAPRWLAPFGRSLRPSRRRRQLRCNVPTAREKVYREGKLHVGFSSKIEPHLSSLNYITALELYSTLS